LCSDAYKKYLKFSLEDKISVANNENSYFEKILILIIAGIFLEKRATIISASIPK
jgi:hypothetical protein